jgi:hypothetical protein
VRPRSLIMTHVSTDPTFAADGLIAEAKKRAVVTA